MYYQAMPGADHKPSVHGVCDALPARKIAEMLSRETQSRFQRLRHYYDLIYDVHDQISHRKLVIREAPL